MNANIHITAAFRNLGLDTGPWRTDDEATTRIGHSDGGVVMVSDHMQGRGQNVKIKHAKTLDVSITTKRRIVKAENVAPEDVQETIEALAEELRTW